MCKKCKKKGRLKSMNAIAERVDNNVVNFVQQNKRKRDAKMIGVKKAIPFSQMSKQAQYETMQAMRDED